MRRFLVVQAVIFLLLSTLASTATAKVLGGCPSGDSWQLVSVASLGISPEESAGIPSLDGNGDGWTCISPSPAAPGSFPAGGSIFRDNTVVATG